MSDINLQSADSIQHHAPIRQLSCLEALRDRRGDVRCFTPALLITHAYLPVDPAQDFIARFPASATLQPFCVELPPNAPPFFSGLPDTVLNGRLVNWNRRLYAIPAERSKECFDFLSGIGAYSSSGFFASSVMYDIAIPDPLSLAAVKTTIDVTVFGVFLDNKITYLAPRFNLPPVVNVVQAENRFKTNLGFKIDDDIGPQFGQLYEEQK